MPSGPTKSLPEDITGGRDAERLDGIFIITFITAIEAIVELPYPLDEIRLPRRIEW